MLIRLLFALCLVLLARAATAESIPLEHDGGTYTVPVLINGRISIPFVLDSGASEVAIPTDVFLTLLRTGTVSYSDFLGIGHYVMADGAEQSSERFVLRELKVGDHVVNNVIANVVSAKGTPLLGQSFLSKLPAWTIDNRRHALVFDETGVPGESQQQVTVNSAPRLPRSGWTVPASPTPTSITVSVSELEQRGLQALSAKDYPDGLRWCRSAAKRGSIICAGAVGELYLLGHGIGQDYSKAFHWSRVAAERGYAAAQTNVGILYANGLGVAQNYGEAMRWFQLAAKQGNPPADYNIGWIYEQERNYSEAMRWYRIAADKGDAKAENNIGMMVAQGLGVQKDCVTAKAWIERAAAAGVELARENLSNGARGVCQW